MSEQEFITALNNGGHAWPGGYPLFFVTNDGASLSFDVAKANKDLICESIRYECADGWRVVAVDVNWEDRNLYCYHSHKLIESAY